MTPVTIEELSHCFYDECGSITTEYAVLLCLVAVGCSLATIGLGAPLVRLFMAQETWVMLAVP
jgi:Flp pilus assembly pilin Flp